MDKNRKKELLEQYKRAKPQMGVFIIRHKNGDKCYLQAANDLRAGMNGALARLNGGMHPNRELLKGWLDYGADSFAIEILEELPYDKDEAKTDYTEELTLLQMIWEEKLIKEGLYLYKRNCERVNNNMDKKNYADIDAYIAQFPAELQEKLSALRKTIQEAAPGAKEKISYQMPAFELYGNLVYFAAFKKHIGFYPTASGIEAFKERLLAYSYSKGAVQFPLDEPLPLALIREIVQYRAAENMRLAQKKKKK